MNRFDIYYLASAFLAIELLSATAVRGQIVPDATTNTITTLEGNTWEITGGRAIDNNLFHSFEQFSIANNHSAFFKNAANIENIFSRVTGNSISQIDGVIRNVAAANLFLINPNGIIFNRGAALDLGGSFVATTADRVLFDNDAEFSATNLDTDFPLLTITSPIGLQLGENPGAISVNGAGHNLANGTLNNPFIRQNNVAELLVQPGKSLTLIGGEIALNGGVLTAEEGLINLASLHDGRITLTDNKAIANLQLTNDNNFGDISLDRKSLLDASGIEGGAIAVFANNLDLDRDSHILIQKFQGSTKSAIAISASDTIDLDRGSALTTENLNTGSTATINVSAKNLNLYNGGNISSLAYENSWGNNIEIEVREDLKLVGFNALIPSFPSVIAGTSLGSGQSANVNVSAKNIFLRAGGNIAAAAFNIGAGGNVNIDVEQSIEIGGTSSILLPSGISAITAGIGSGGDLSITTGSLTIDDSGIINAATVRGSSGNIKIDAREYISISGSNQFTSVPSIITSSVEQEFSELPLPDFVDFPERLSGTSGSILLNTPRLEITDGARISVTNDGNNDAGNLAINANSLLLENQSSIGAVTEFGNGGNIELQIQNDILLKGQSSISSTANQIGRGGNIIIDTTILTAIGNSDITANARDSFGGQISIDALSVFGTRIEDSLTPQSDITATSKLGAEFSGIVKIDLSNANPVVGTAKLPQNPIDASQQITSSCKLDRNNTFAIIGKGGLASNPQSFLRSQNILQDWRVSSDDKQWTVDGQKLPIASQTTAVIEAEKLIVNHKGVLELVANSDRHNWKLKTARCDARSNRS